MHATSINFTHNTNGFVTETIPYLEHPAFIANCEIKVTKGARERAGNIAVKNVKLSIECAELIYGSNSWIIISAFCIYTLVELSGTADNNAAQKCN